MLTKEKIQLSIALFKFEQAKKETDPEKTARLADEAIEALDQPPAYDEKTELKKRIIEFMHKGSPEEVKKAAVKKEESKGNIEKNIAEAERLASEKKFDEALKLLGEARSIAAEHDDTELKEIVDKKVEEIQKKKKLEELDETIDKFMEKNVFFSPEKAEETCSNQMEHNSSRLHDIEKAHRGLR